MQQIVDSMANGKEYEIIVKPFRRSRSLDANAYFWLLVNLLSNETGLSPIDIYRSYIQDVGGNYVIVPVREDIISEWDRAWCDGHDGRITVDMGECRNIEGYHNVRCYMGSSDYNSQQMARLIDMVIDDCKMNGIETMPEYEKEALIEEWGRYEKHSSN